MHEFTPGELEYWSVSLLEMIILLHLAENVIFGFTSPDCVAIAQFACQFARSSPYVARGERFFRIVLLAGSLLPRTHCAEGR